MAYYAVLKLSIYYRYYFKVSIILGLHKVRAMRGTQNLRITHQLIQHPAMHAYFAETGFY
jgi:hypothetical protein